MQQPLLPQHAPASAKANGNADATHTCAPPGHADHQFAGLLDSYRSSGGLARADELLALFSCRGGPDVGTLARWIVERKVLSFEWQSETWLPLFQFNRFDMTPQPQLATVLAELAWIYDPWELANWFVQPNASLAERTPADAVRADLSLVLRAARADRSIANG